MDSLTLFILFCGSIPSVVAHFNPFMDNDMYMINWAGPLQLDSTSDEAAVKENEMVVVTTQHNEKYQCELPEDPKLKDAHAKAKYLGASPNELMETLFTQKTCSYRIESYWTYELCHGKHLRQYHETKEPQKQKSSIQEYFLGLGGRTTPKEAAGTEEVKAEYQIKSKKIEGVVLPFYEVNMTDGSNCDLTNHPRQARVLYVCQPEGRGEIYEFKEIRTCEYEIIVLTYVLCSHPEFKPKNPPVNQIKCYSMEGSPARPKQLDSMEKESSPKSFDQKKSDMGETTETFTFHIEGSVEDSGETSGPRVSIRRKVEPKDPAPTPAPLGSTTDNNLIRDFLNGDYCLQGGGGWWKHEYCHGKYVRQYHDDSEGRTLVHLGIWDKDDHLKWLEENPHKKPKPIDKRKYISFYYSSGDICELTGKQRKTEVRLKCVKNDQQPHSIALYLLEPAVCDYILGVESQLFCSLLDKANDDTGIFQDVDV